MSYPTKTAAIILLETLIALLLSLLLLSWLTITYLSLARHHAIQKSWSKIQENFTVACQMLTREIKLSGYLGCVSLHNLPALQYRQSYLLSSSNKLSIAHPQSQYDVITVRHRSIASSILLNDMTNNHELYVSKNLAFAPGDLVLLADCTHAEIGQISAITINQSSQKLSLTHNITHPYKRDAEIGLVEENSYIFNHGTLYRRNIKGHVSHLINGIQIITIDTALSDTTITGLSLMLKLFAGKISQRGYVFINVAS